MLLLEDIDEIYSKYYSGLPHNKFNQLIRLDPTYRDGSNHLGKYGKWILLLYTNNNNLDVGHVTDILTRFESVYRDLKEHDIGRFRSLEELENYMNDLSNYRNLTARQLQARKNREVHKFNVDDIASPVYEDSDWEVYIPNSFEASCKLGRNTSWCTATTSSQYYYDRYTNQGPLYIIINKDNPKEKYQLHIESQSFMNKDDEATDMIAAFGENSNIIEDYFRPLLKEHCGNGSASVIGFIPDERSVKDFISVYTEEVGIHEQTALLNVLNGELRFISNALADKILSPIINEMLKKRPTVDLLATNISPIFADSRDSEVMEKLLKHEIWDYYDDVFSFDDYFIGDAVGYDNLNSENKELLAKLGVNEANFDEKLRNDDFVGNSIQESYEEAVIFHMQDYQINKFIDALENALPDGIYLEKVYENKEHHEMSYVFVLDSIDKLKEEVTNKELSE